MRELGDGQDRVKIALDTAKNKATNRGTSKSINNLQGKWPH